MKVVTIEVIKLISGIVAAMVIMSVIVAVIDLRWGGHKDSVAVYGKGSREVLYGVD